MTIKKKIKKVTKNPKIKSNPEWFDALIGRKRTSIEADVHSIGVDGGVIILRGSKMAELNSDLEGLLNQKMSSLKIEFIPFNSKKRYILNKTSKDIEIDLDDEGMGGYRNLIQGPKGRGRSRK